MGGKIKKVRFTYWLTLFSLNFLILRTIYFIAFFDLRPPSSFLCKNAIEKMARANGKTT